MRTAMSKELATTNSNALDFNNREILAAIRETVAKDTTAAEFTMFVQYAKSTGLNPFKKEIWCIVLPAKNGRARQVQIMGGINGFYEIANEQPEYDGMEKGFVGPNGEYLPSTYPKEDYIGAWCRVYRKDRRFPQEEIAMLKEFDKHYGNWQSQRRVMIQKCADAFALRKAFPQKLNGLYIPEEMPPEFAAPTDEPKAKRPTVMKADELPATIANDPLPEGDIDQRPDNEKRNASAVYVYDLRNMPADKKKLAEKLLQAADASWDDDEACWFSTTEISKLCNYLRQSEGASA
jgi:phage recombination protein Bet